VISKVFVRNFKRLVEAECDLARVTTIVGSNNSGKSSFLQALHFAASLARSARLYADAAFPDEGPLEVQLPSERALYMPCPVPSAIFADVARALEIKLTDANGSCTMQVELAGEAFQIRMDGAVLGEQMLGRANFSVLAPGLSGIGAREQRLSAAVVARAIARGDANSVFRNVMATLLMNAATKARFLTAMTSIFARIDFRVAHNDEIDPFINIEFESDGRWLPIEVAGNGVLQACQVMAYTELYGPRVFMLDEPDSHLHPENQRKLCALLTAIGSAPLTQNQVIISTHSRHVMDAMQGIAKPLWVRDGQPRDAEAMHFTPMLMELGALDEIDRIAMQNTKCVVATEDEKPELLKILLEENGFIGAETIVVPYLGTGKIDAALILSQYLNMRTAGTRLVVHRDRDYLSDEAIEKIRKKLEGAGILLFVTKGKDVEHYFLNAEHLSVVSQVPLADVETAIKDGIAATREKSIASLIDHKTLAAFDHQRATGEKVPHGKLGVSAVAEYDANPAALCYGKKALKATLAMLQARTGNNINAASKTGKLRVAELEAIALQIWSAPTGGPPPVAGPEGGGAGARSGEGAASGGTAGPGDPGARLDVSATRRV
jgi:predicted ATPase